MYELIVLSLLMRSPLHGYLIVKITNDMIGPWAKISSGTLYPLLGKMEQAGLITVLTTESQTVQAVSGGRPTRTFMITEEGRKRFHQVMMDMSSNLGDYPKIFRYKMVFIDLMQPQERLLLLNHYINYCQTSILHMQTEMANLAHELSRQPNPHFLTNILRVVEHVEQREQMELDWARSLRDQELMQKESHLTGTFQTDEVEKQ